MTQESTNVKNFTGWDEFNKKTSGHKLYVKLHGCLFYVPVTKKAIKQIYDTMNKFGFKSRFQGNINISQHAAQVTFNQI